ncbi:CHAT domain-containing protein [Sphaerisporangium aureirubrum]|uniref:CHAT domain-containing protein n=1 Tax=Sphaerisporangium aureirubrum TaxID=1544736 RepID=A0ABW1NNG2_9ACTN
MAEPVPGVPSPQSQITPEAADLAELRAARRELDEVVALIREVPGYEDFLAAPTFADVAAAAEGPLCYVTPAEAEGLALIVRGDDVEHVPLPELTTDEVRARVTGLFASYDEFRPREDAAPTAWELDLDAVTRWLWDAAMGDILGRLTPHDGTAEDALTLVPGGLLGLLPLHAAWTADPATPTGRRHALDVTTVSYAPNARSLTAARKIARERPGHTLLAVTDPRPMPEWYPEMPYTALDTMAATAALPAAARTLAGEEATVAAVRDALPAADVLHFACHGRADLAEPLDSALMLSGGHPLRLRDLLAMDLRIRLAVLSACETSLPGTELPDEVVALPTGLLQAGAAGVVASLWAIPDLATSMVVTEFYRRWRGHGLSPGAALRDAQRWVRDTTNAEKAAVWERDLEAGDGLPPHDVADALLDVVTVREPGDRDESRLSAWAGFCHVGV